MENEALSTVNELIETLKDGQKGFETAAADVKDVRVKSAFHEFAQERARQASELQSQIVKLGGDAPPSGSASAAVHRGWMDIKSALGGGEKSILNEAERGEDVAVKSFEKAMQVQLPPDVDSIVRRQYSEVRRVHDRVREMRDSWK